MSTSTSRQSRNLVRPAMIVLVSGIAALGFALVGAIVWQVFVDDNDGDASEAATTNTTIDRKNFVGSVTNQWFPLPEGKTYRYTGSKDNKHADETYAITRDKKIVNGVSCTVVHDSLYLDGKLGEQTDDWYAQDATGNVWYFGEDTKTFDENGKVTSTEGSWEAGKNGAAQGIVVPANPTVGLSSTEEVAPGVAEDHSVVLNLNSKVDVPAGHFDKALTTANWTPLEPDALDQKFYSKGIGVVKEVALAGDQEELVLVAS